jgi:hypothetical protein
MSNFSSACDSNNLATCTADHFLPRAAGSRAPPSPAATARSDSQPPACSSWMVGASPPRLRTSPRPGMAPTSAWERRQGDSRTRREAATGLLNRHRQSRGRKSAHEKSSAGGRKLATLCLHSPGRAEYILWARVSQGAPGLVMLSSTCSYISAVTLLLQCTSGNAVLAQEGQATTATASANDRGDACAQSIEKVINLCMIRGLNNSPKPGEDWIAIVRKNGT